MISTCNFKEHVILRNIFIPWSGREAPEGSKVVFYHAYLPPIQGDHHIALVRAQLTANV